MRHRTHIADVVNEQIHGVKREGEVDAILDASLSSTQAAIDNSSPLLDWDEYKGADL